MTAELTEKFGAKTALCDLPKAELETGGAFDDWLSKVSGSDQSAFNNMQDGHSWSGDVESWLTTEAEIAVRSAIENAVIG